jgi:hypothetical protein
MRLEGDSLRSSIGARPKTPLTGPRQEDDFYRTHPSALDALLDVEQFDGPVWEPACGDGILIDRMIFRGMEVIASDLHDYGCAGASQWDFFARVPTGRFNNIITNPPYKAAEAFALRALSVTPICGKVALLCRLLWLEGMGRKKRLFQPFPPARVWVFSKRPLLAKGNGEFRTGLLAFAWYVWRVGHKGQTEVNWL